MARAQFACLLLLPPLLLLRWLPIKKVPSESWRDPAFIRRMVNEHNEYRMNVTPDAANMYYMSWDEDLAKTACSWARQCTPAPNPRLIIPGTAHPVFLYLGENIWFAHESMGNKPLQTWASESEIYNFSDNSCSGICGHYKQMIWAQTYKVGCSAELCETLEDMGNRHARHGHHIRFVVCNYAPIGNYRTRRPYIRGEPCSHCPAGDTCENKLCRNSRRDIQNVSSTWAPPWACGGGGHSRPPGLQRYSALLLTLTCIAVCFAAEIPRPALMISAFRVFFSI